MKDKILKYKELSPNREYFDLVKIFGLSLDKLFKVMGVNKYKIKDDYFEIYDNYGNEIYKEYSNGRWWKRELDNNCNVTYSKDSDGGWYKREYDSNGKLVYSEDSRGYWTKRKYKNDKIINWEDSDGYKESYLPNINKR